MLIGVLVAVFALTMFLGVPIALCLGLGGLAFIVLSGVVPIAVLPTLMFAGMDSFPAPGHPLLRDRGRRDATLRRAPEADGVRQ